MKPTILTDIDGVCLSWQSGLPYFAQKYNLPLEHILKMIQDEKFISPGKLFNCDEELGVKLIEKYNRSDFIRYLSPYKDALCVINKLKEDYNFVAVTALGDSIDALLNRQFNLNALFPGAFSEVLMCGHDSSKEELFKKAKEKYNVICYIDDLAHHCDHASEILNVPVYWMARGERDSIPKTAQRVYTWNDVENKLFSPKENKESFDSEKAIKDVIEKMIKNDSFPWNTTWRTPGFNPYNHLYHPYQTHPFQTWNYIKPGGVEYLYNRPTSGDNIFQGAF